MDEAKLETDKEELLGLIREWLTKKGILDNTKEVLEIDFRVKVVPGISIGEVSVDLDEVLAQKLKNCDFELPPHIGPGIWRFFQDKFTLGNLVRCSEKYIRQQRNMGDKRIAVIEVLLAQKGLTLGLKVEAGPREKQLVLSSSVEEVFGLHYHGDYSLHCRDYLTMFSTIESLVSAGKSKLSQLIDLKMSVDTKKCSTSANLKDKFSTYYEGKIEQIVKGIDDRLREFGIFLPD